MNRSSELAWRPWITLIKRNISYLWKRKLILSTTFGGDMLIPRKNILICNLQTQKFQMIWFRRTFPMFLFLNFPSRERVCFSAYWGSPHWMATSRSSGERVLPWGSAAQWVALLTTRGLLWMFNPAEKMSQSQSGKRFHFNTGWTWQKMKQKNNPSPLGRRVLLR